MADQEKLDVRQFLDNIKNTLYKIKAFTNPLSDELEHYNDGLFSARTYEPYPEEHQIQSFKDGYEDFKKIVYYFKTSKKEKLISSEISGFEIHSLNFIPKFLDSTFNPEPSIFEIVQNGLQGSPDVKEINTNPFSVPFKTKSQYLSFSSQLDETKFNAFKIKRIDILSDKLKALDIKVKYLYTHCKKKGSLLQLNRQNSGNIEL